MALRAPASFGLTMYDTQWKGGVPGRDSHMEEAILSFSKVALPWLLSLLLVSIYPQYSNMAGRRVIVICAFPAFYWQSKEE